MSTPSGRYKRQKTSLEGLGTALDRYEAALCRPPDEHRAGVLYRAASAARICERLLTDQQVQDPAYPALLARLKRLEQLKRAQVNPAEALRQRIQAAAALLGQHPGDLTDQLLAILRPDEP